MAQGKYTQFGSPKGPRTDLLNKLFGSHVSEGNRPPTQGTPTKAIDEATAIAAVHAIAIAPVVAGVGGLIPSDGKQVGDPLLFPEGVDLTFGNSPDVSTVKWDKPGAPANPYAPDITSPGPGKTEGTDKDVDPNLSADELKQAITNGSKNFVPDDNTKNPAVSGPKIGTGVVNTFAQLPTGGSLPKGSSGG